jgi:hypothetical protein
MSLISLKEYAELNGKNPDNARQMALRGSFDTARKIGNMWVIESSEPWPDRRKKDNQNKRP